MAAAGSIAWWVRKVNGIGADRFQTRSSGNASGLRDDAFTDENGVK